MKRRNCAAAAALKDGQAVFVPNTGHMIPWDDLGAFLGLCEAAVSTVEVAQSEPVPA